MRTLTQIVEEMYERGMDRTAVQAWLDRHAYQRHNEDIDEICALIEELTKTPQSVPRDAVIQWLALERIRHSHEASAAATRSADTPLFMDDEKWASARRGRPATRKRAGRRR